VTVAARPSSGGRAVHHHAEVTITEPEGAGVAPRDHRDRSAGIPAFLPIMSRTS
jgi:hypothetical protein